MRRAIVVAAAATVGVAMVLPASAGAAAYTKYVSCDRKPLQRSHLCPRDGSRTKVFVVFRSHRADVNWKPCVRTPTGRLSCAPTQSARRGVLYTIGFTGIRAGTYKFSWRVGGRQVGGTWNVFFKR